MSTQKYKITSNISAVQINFDGVNSDFYLRDNTAFKDKVISEVRWFAAPAAGRLCPFDGTQLMQSSLLGSFYTDLVKNDKEVFMQGMPLANLQLKNSIEVMLNKTINFNMSRIYTTDISGIGQLAGKSIMMYVEFGSRETDIDLFNIDKRNAVTVHISSNAKRLCLGTYIDTYIHSMGKRVLAVSSKITAGAFYISLRDRGGHIFEYVPSDRIEENNSNDNEIREPMLLDGFDVDFRDSWIDNATSGMMTFDLTFYY